MIQIHIRVLPVKFQSTFPRGERLEVTMDRVRPQQFQSTFPRGERQEPVLYNQKPDDFNPRSRVGNDLVVLVD